jgi:hypothetical protein
VTHAAQRDSGIPALLKVLQTTPHEHVLHGGRRERPEALEDEYFVRNELTEPDEGVSVESRSIKDLQGIRLVCVA